MAYHEIAGTREYEYRYEEDGRFTGWVTAGPASVDTLAEIVAGLPDTPYEVRQVCEVADDAGVHVGRLVFSELVARSEG